MNTRHKSPSFFLSPTISYMDIRTTYIHFIPLFLLRRTRHPPSISGYTAEPRSQNRTEIFGSVAKGLVMRDGYYSTLPTKSRAGPMIHGHMVVSLREGISALVTVYGSVFSIIVSCFNYHSYPGGCRRNYGFSCCLYFFFDSIVEQPSTLFCIIYLPSRYNSGWWS